MDGRPIRASKCAANGAKNTGSSSSASTRPNSAGNTNSSDGKIASHNVGWSLTVLSTMASIPSIPRVRGHPPGSAPSDPGSTRRLFQVEVARACLLILDGGASPHDRCGQENAAEEGQRIFVVAGGHSAPLLEPVEAAFNGVALLVDCGVEQGWAATG